MITDIQLSDKIQAFKVFDERWQCQGYQFEVGKTYTHDGTVRMCNTGFHACTKLEDCFSYKEMMPYMKVAKVTLWGNVDSTDEDCSKVVASHISMLLEFDADMFFEITGIRS